MIFVSSRDLVFLVVVTNLTLGLIIGIAGNVVSGFIRRIKMKNELAAGIVRCQAVFHVHCESPQHDEGKHINFANEVIWE